MFSLVMVDDEIWTLRDMEVLLQDVQGFALAGSYTNPVEAEKAIRLSPPDVVLTDLRMEEMSGQMLMKSIHEHCPQTHVIICSAYRDFDAAREAIHFGAVDYLLKPIAKPDFLRAFDKIRELPESEKEKVTGFTHQRVFISHHSQIDELVKYMKKEAPCPCYVETEDDAFARVYYDNSTSMERWISSLTEEIGFSREQPAGTESTLQRREALAALAGGFVYTDHKPLDDVQSYIALHCNEKLTLASIAERVGFSSAYLCDLFSKKCGVQLFAFIKQVRIGTACHLLRTTSLPVNVISAQVGYEDNSHFCREFKHAKGVTPNSYRRLTEPSQDA